MKAPQFAYAKPASLAAAFALFDQHGDDAKILAGGQSLVATLNMRLSSPGILVDVTGIPGLAGITVTGDVVRIGALTTHRAIEHSPVVAEKLPLLAQAVPHIAHVAIRNSGTIGGSIAFADPAAEWPTCAVTLDATLVLASKAGERRVKAVDFFEGLYTTALQPGEMIVAIEFPATRAGYRTGFMELARRHGDYGIAGVAAIAKVDGGVLRGLRLGYLGLGGTPILGKGAMAALEGKAPDGAALDAAKAALERDLDPIGDLYSTPATKLHLAKVLTGRVLAALVK